MAERFGDVRVLAAIDGAMADFSGTLACYARNLETGEELGIDADAVVPTASVIKVAIMAELYRQAAAGDVDLKRRIALEERDRTGGTGILKEFAPGLAPTVADLCRVMICLSDNVATGVLVRLLGKERINASLRAWGFPETRVVMEMGLGEDIRRYALSTARELGGLMAAIAEVRLLDAAACAAMRAHLSRQQHLEQFARGLPFSPYLEELGLRQPVRLMNKIGNYLGMRADAAIVEAPGARFVLAAVNQGSSDWGFGIDHEGNVLNGRLARIVFDHWVDADRLAVALAELKGAAGAATDDEGVAAPV